MQRLNYGTVDRLIELVRENRELYDRHDVNYRKMDYKNNTWHKIAMELNCEDEDAKKAWRSLRDKYVRVLQDNAPSRLSFYEYGEKLEWLREFTKPAKTGKYHNTYDDEDDLRFEHEDDNTVLMKTDSDNLEGGYQNDVIIIEDPFNDVVEGTTDIRYTPSPKKRRKQNARKQNTFDEYTDYYVPPTSKKMRKQHLEWNNAPDESPSYEYTEHSSKKVRTDTSNSLEDTADYDSVSDNMETQPKEQSSRNHQEDPLKEFLHTILKDLRVARSPQMDVVDNFFLNMAASVKEANITGKNLLHLKCNMMNHLLNEINKFT